MLFSFCKKNKTGESQEQVLRTCTNCQNLKNARLVSCYGYCMAKREMVGSTRSWPNRPCFGDYERCAKNCNDFTPKN